MHVLHSFFNQNSPNFGHQQLSMGTFMLCMKIDDKFKIGLIFGDGSCRVNLMQIENFFQLFGVTNSPSHKDQKTLKE